MAVRNVSAPSVSDYSVILCPQTELDLEHTLASGQAFRWHRDAQGWWSAVIGPEPVVLRCWQDREQLYYQTYPKPADFSALRAYFQLDVDLARLTSGWEATGGEQVRSAITHFSGLRVTRQDPVECLFSFLCSSVAPIYRIRRIIDTMCRTLGVRLGEVGGRDHYAFPKLDHMAEASRDLYDKMGFGFRGGNIRETALELSRRGERAYVVGLRDRPYAEAKVELMSLPGVGAKIADCVCLFSLGMHEAVPLDVHVTRVARQLFSQARSIKSLTPKTYLEVAGLFRDRFGPYAGWAQQYLFYNELLQSGSWDQEMGTHVPATKRLKSS
jgi:N-glycosylase/DNA lyase